MKFLIVQSELYFIVHLCVWRICYTYANWRAWRMKSMRRGVMKLWTTLRTGGFRNPYTPTVVSSRSLCGNCLEEPRLSQRAAFTLRCPIVSDRVDLTVNSRDRIFVDSIVSHSCMTSHVTRGIEYITY